MRPSVGALDDAGTDTVVAIATEMRDRHNWHGAEGGFSLERSWVNTASQNAFHVVKAIPSGERIVLKMGGQVRRYGPGRIFDSMSDLADALDESERGVRGLRPIGWLASPSVVATPYVEGVDLIRLLPHKNHTAWEHESTALGVVEAAGTALAVFHSSVGSTEGRNYGYPSTSDDLKCLSRRLVLPSRTVSMLVSEANIATAVGPAFGDFHPGNIRLSEVGDIYVFDAPPHKGFALVHRDIAYFEFEARKRLAFYGTGRNTYRTQGTERQIRAAFFVGYAAASTFDPARHEARILITAIQARLAGGMARQLVRRRRLRDATWALILAITLRRRAIRMVNRR